MSSDKLELPPGSLKVVSMPNGPKQAALNVLEAAVKSAEEAGDNLDAVICLVVERRDEQIYTHAHYNADAVATLGYAEILKQLVLNASGGGDG